MIEIEFSVMESSPGEANHLLPLLAAFEHQYNIHVNLTGISWYTGWEDVAQFGLFGNGPDVSSIGTTWIGSMAAMQALRPFTSQQIRSLGGENAFFKSIWQSSFLPNNQTAWAIPWLGDALVIYYLKDALEKAGIQDAQTAFASETNLLETLKTLQKNGYPYPLALTTKNISMILHEAAIWIWNAGGNFMDADNQKITFNLPPALDGWKNYFNLKPFISPETLTTPLVGAFIESGDCPIHIGGPWMGLIGRNIQPEWGQRLGIAAVPGTTYVGGSSLVIWQYSKRSQEAFELIRFLSSQPCCIPTSPHSYELPTRCNAIHMTSAETDIFHRTYLDALQKGKNFPTDRLWGTIEEKLIEETANIWADLFADPDQDLDKCLHQHLDPLAEKLNRTLQS